MRLNKPTPQVSINLSKIESANFTKQFPIVFTFELLFCRSNQILIGNVKKCAVGKHPKSEKLDSTGQAACCARTHSRYFTGGSPSGLRV